MLMRQLMGKLESLREGRNELEKEREELIKAMAMLQARTEEAFNEQVGRL
jgi:predicted nuclease with TOPRIM domain